MSAGETVASKAATWLLRVVLDVIFVAINKNRARICNDSQTIAVLLIRKDQLITLHV